MPRREYQHSVYLWDPVDNTAQLQEVRNFRNSSRQEVIAMLSDEVRLHKETAAIEMENDMLTDELAIVNENIRLLEAELSKTGGGGVQQNSYSGNEKELGGTAVNSLIEELDSSESASSSVNTSVPSPSTSQRDENGGIRPKFRPSYRTTEVQFQKRQQSQEPENEKETSAAIVSRKRRKTNNDTSSSGPSSSSSELEETPRTPTPTDVVSSRKKSATHKNFMIYIPGDSVTSLLQRSITTSNIRASVGPKVLTSRQELADIYGGSTHHLVVDYPLLGKPRRKLESIPGATKKNHRFFLFPQSSPELSEHFPACPGAHGLMFGMNYQVELRVRNKGKKDNEKEFICEVFAPAKRAQLCATGSDATESIQYYGTYRITEQRLMTKEEFKNQKDEVKTMIASEIGKANLVGSTHYLRIKARSVCQKKGKEIEDWPCTNRKEYQFLHKLGSEVDEDDIIRDLLNGDEGLPILVMRFIKYDAVLAKHLIRTISAHKS